MFEYSNKMPNDPWLPFLNLTTNERVFTANNEQVSDSIINGTGKLITHRNPFLNIQL